MRNERHITVIGDLATLYGGGRPVARVPLTASCATSSIEGDQIPGARRYVLQTGFAVAPTPAGSAASGSMASVNDC
jgi:hypothetical protein